MHLLWAAGELPGEVPSTGELCLFFFSSLLTSDSHSFVPTCRVLGLGHALGCPFACVNHSLLLSLLMLGNHSEYQVFSINLPQLPLIVGYA